jgi:hypothetical protein
MKILRFNKYNFLSESYSDFNQFNQMGMGVSPLPGYGFAVDPKMSIYGHADSPYVDNYYRTPMLVNTLLDIIKGINKDAQNNYGAIKYDQFLEDVDEFKNFKILRTVINASYHIDIYVSFEFGDDEFFGLFKNFNSIQKVKFTTDLFTDSNYRYINTEYRLKLDNYFRKVLNKWFKPKKGWFINLNKNLYVRNKLGNKILLPKDAKINVTTVGNDKDNNPYIKFLYKGEELVLNKNDYFFFNYWFEQTTEN